MAAEAINPASTACMQKKWSRVPVHIKSYGVRGLDSTGSGEAIHWAAWHGHVPSVQLLLEHVADIDALNQDGLQAVHLAARNGQLGALLALWEHDPTVICRGDGQGKTAMHWAAEEGFIYVIEWLYVHGSPMNSKDIFGFTPLHWAAWEGRALCAQLLLRCGVSVQSGDINGRTPLHWIGLKSRAGLLDVALRISPDLFSDISVWQSRDHDGKTAREVATWCGADPCVNAQFATTEAWLRCTSWWRRNECPNNSRLNALCDAPLRNPIFLLPSALLWYLHVVNVAIPAWIMFRHLHRASRLLNTHALWAFAQLVCQFLSLRFWLLTSFADPGRCAATKRCNAQHPGSDAHERLVGAVQVELNELAKRRIALVSALGKTSPQHDAGDTSFGLTHCGLPSGRTEASDVRLTDELLKLDASLEAGKRQLAERLQDASVARLACYPGDYVKLLFQGEVEKSPQAWGRRACVICGRLRTRRSKHCKECGHCVARFDHHCPWVGNCVGANNLVSFTRFLFWLCLALICSGMLNFELLVAMPLRREMDTLSWWRVCLKLSSWLNVAWFAFVAILLGCQICFAALDITSYEVESDACTKALANFKCEQLLGWRGIVSTAARNVVRLLVFPSDPETTTVTPRQPGTRSSRSRNGDVAAVPSDPTIELGLFHVEQGACNRVDAADARTSSTQP
eukprot:TRINITY_DN62029_c0_g1_i1.p1 TRINITY_DN62029_c0_g1~~TRINITY_DN62029_c0_g1_i1.p1  ORF type:complete len:683 (-),score=77.26 TRINITY_DN62029_c0_g1_i1:114-2162(-)